MQHNINRTLTPINQLRQCRAELRWVRESLECCDPELDAGLIKQYKDKIKAIMEIVKENVKHETK